MQTIQLSKKQSYGSIINRLSESCSAFPLNYEVKVGLGGTEYMWSDRKPYTVCVVHNNWKTKVMKLLVFKLMITKE